jgi:acetoin utilization deacetylase AcuC-like enzyme
MPVLLPPVLLPLVSSPHYSFDFPERHRFPMQKFALLLEHLQHLGIANTDNVYRSGKARLDLLELAHCPEYLNNFINGNLSDKEVRRMGLPWSEGLVKRTLISPNGTLLTASLALRSGLACHLAGGTHHAHYDFASGYCILNDLAIAALALVRQARVQRVLIFDCDVHQGDGTATILQDVAEITTCSIHCEKNFPQRKAKSDIDIEVKKGVGDHQYLNIVTDGLARALKTSQPDLVIYDAGVDVFEGDPLGMLNISLDGIRAREAMIIKTVRDLGIPLATVIGGGYDKDQAALARRHAIVVEEAHRYLSVL